MGKHFFTLLGLLLASGIASANLYMCNNLSDDTMVIDVSDKTLQVLDSQGLGGTHLRRIAQRFKGYDTFAGQKSMCPPSRDPNQAACTSIELLMLTVSPSMLTGSTDGLLWEGPLPASGQHYNCRGIK